MAGSAAFVPRWCRGQPWLSTNECATVSVASLVTGHIVIAGPGRSGTTLLVKLLAELGFDTAGRLRPFSDAAQAGLEDDILAADAPRVVKNPDLSWQLREYLESGKVAPGDVEWLLVPLRDLGEAAASRIRITTLARDVHAPGGLVRTSRPSKQRQQLAEVTYGLFETAALFELPLIVLEYPRFAQDAGYAFRCLRPLLADRSEADFTAGWEAVVDPALVRHAPVPIPVLASWRMTLLLARRGIVRRLRRR